MQKMSSALHFSKTKLSVAKEHDTHWVPNTDVYVIDGAIIIKVELAGMQRENLELTIDGPDSHPGPAPGRMPPAQVQIPGHGNQLRRI